LFFVVEIPILIIVILCLLFYYSARKGANPWYVHLFVGLAWFFCLLVIALVPLDLAETLVDRCHLLVVYSEYTGYQQGDCPIHETRPGFVYILWLIIYWSCFVLTWICLPIFSQYAIAGDYSLGKRLQSALYSNALFYAICGVFILGFGIYMAIRYHLSAYSFMGLLIGLSNAFGLLGVIAMLGYGTVQIPRVLWNRGNLHRRLRYCEFKTTEYTDRMDEARADLAKILGQLERIQQQQQWTMNNNPTSNRDEEQPHIHFLQHILQEIPQDIDVPAPDRTAEIPKTITENFLARLHQRLKQRVVEYRKSNYLWSRTCEEAFRLEDWIAWTNQVTWKQRIAIFHKNAWHTFYFPCGYRFCALIALLFSILVVWSETTIWSFKTFHGYVDLSPLSLWIHRQGMSNYSIQLISWTTIVYLALCVYFSLFHFNLYRFYELFPQHTDSYSLFLNALLCCRFTVPLCYNFLTIVHETAFAVPLLYPQLPHAIATTLPVTSFSRVEQSMQVLPILGNSFNAFFPIVLIVLVLATGCQLWTRVLAAIGLKQFGFEQEDDLHYERLGRELLQREKQRRRPPQD